MPPNFTIGEIDDEELLFTAKRLSQKLTEFSFPSEKNYQLGYLTSGGSGHIFVLESEEDGEDSESYCIKILKRDQAKQPKRVEFFRREALISKALGDLVGYRGEKYPPIGIKCIETRNHDPYSEIVFDEQSNLSLPFFVSQRGLSLARLLKQKSQLEDEWEKDFYETYWTNYSNRGDIACQIRTMIQSLDLALYHLHCSLWSFSSNDKEPAYHLDIKAENICVIYEKGVYNYLFMDFGSIRTESEWTQTQKFYTTYDTLPEPIRSILDIREATSDKRVPVDRQRVDDLGILPAEIDHHQLGRVFLDILQSRTSYERIRNLLSAYENNLIYEITSCLLWSDDKTDTAKISPNDKRKRVSDLYETISNSSSNLHSLFGPGFLPIPGTSLYKFDDRINDLIKTKVFRKLRGIKQLGLSCLVYPGATHTRFEHSLGTFQVAHDYLRSLISRTGSIWLTLRISPEDIKMCLLHALFHDLGHYPFAHYLEDTGIFPKHRHITKWILTNDRDRLGINCSGDESCPSPKGHDSETHCPARLANKEDLDEFHHKMRVLYQTTPEHWKAWFEKLEKSSTRPRNSTEGLYYGLSQIIDGPIDADAFDYVRRDSAHCGFSSIGTIERELFLSNLSFYSRPTSESEVESYVIGLREQAHCVIEQINLARYHLYSLVYWSPKCRCYTALVRDAVCRSYKTNVEDAWISIGKWCREGTDESVLGILRNEWGNKNDKVPELVNDIENTADFQVICEIPKKKPAFNAMMRKAEIGEDIISSNSRNIPKWIPKGEFHLGGGSLTEEIGGVISKELGLRANELNIVIDVPLQGFTLKQKAFPAIIDEYGRAMHPGAIWNAINPALEEWPMKIRVLLRTERPDNRLDDV